MISYALSVASRIWSRNCILLVAVVGVTYWPLDILQSYIGYHWLDPSRSSQSHLLASFVRLFLLVIPDAAVCHVGLLCLANKECSLTEALYAGLNNYGRMWLTRFLYYLSVFTLFLLIIPGLYLLTRWSVSQVCTVAEKRSGTGALRCSWRATHGKFWRVFGANLFGGVAFFSLTMLPRAAFYMLPNHWLSSAFTSMASSVLVPYWLLYGVGIYAHLSSLEETAKGPQGHCPAES